ncbi:hypothetical protein [Shewanella sp.]|uniref:hypothetical protein n=1 Tax=Shewanella sp. TaxID=50422 RepID=UPI003D0A1FEA
MQVTPQELYKPRQPEQEYHWSAIKLNAVCPEPLALTSLDLLEESAEHQRRQHKFLGISLTDLMLVLGVLLLHLFLLSMLSWRYPLYHGPALRAEPSTKAISAYMLSAAQFEAMTKRELANQAAPLKNSSESQLVAPVTKEQSFPSLSQLKSPGASPPQKQLIQSQKHSPDRGNQQTQTAGAEKSQAKSHDIEPELPRRVAEQGFTFEAPDLTGYSEPPQERPFAGELGVITGDYLAWHRQALIDKLVQRAADAATMPKSISEMDGQMAQLALPKIDEYNTAITLDSKLDPNRIVKLGDTCYRVVKVATPINPHAENLGFPFKCGEDKVKQAIKASLDRHLELMGVSQKSNN